jgi:Recombinase
MGDVMKKEQEIGPAMCIRVSKDERAQDALNKCGTLPSSTHENNIDVAAAGQLPANIYGALRQFSFYYSEMVRERSRLAVAAGRVPWRAPIGYVNISSKAGPNIKPDGERAPLIARAFELMATGLHKRSDVLKFVTSEGLTTVTGKPVSPRSFDNILRNPTYAGWIPLSKSGECPPARGLHQPIITQELFDRVQAVRAGKEAIAVGRPKLNLISYRD